MSGHTTETAPKRIWLQVNPDAREDAETGGVEGDDEPFPDGDVTWCWHSIGGLEVEYVRADLVRATVEVASQVDLVARVAAGVKVETMDAEAKEQES